MELEELQHVTFVKPSHGAEKSWIDGGEGYDRKKNKITSPKAVYDDDTPRICPERCVIFTESMKKSEGKPIALRRSQAFYDVLDQMSVYVNAGELIVGNQAQWPKSSPIYPQYSTEWLRSELVEGEALFPQYAPRRPLRCGARGC